MLFNTKYRKDEKSKEQAVETNPSDFEDQSIVPKVTNETKRVRILSKTKMFMKHDGTIIEDRSFKKFNRVKRKRSSKIFYSFKERNY